MSGKSSRKERHGALPNAKKHIDAEDVLKNMPDGAEYEGLLNALNKYTFEPVQAIKQIFHSLYELRGHPCIGYIANTINGGARSSIINEDDVPFSEMVSRVSDEFKEVDIVLITNGGVIDQVPKFVDTLRPRFEKVHFLLPGTCMSAGTLWALSGNSIWMGPRSYIGPIDPQLPGRDGLYAPAQSLLILLNYIFEQSSILSAKGQPIPWTLIRLVDQMNHERLGQAINLTHYAENIAATYLAQYKFSGWNVHSAAGGAVTQEEKTDRAKSIAQLLAQSSHWKSHGHSISRDRAVSELKIKIEHFEEQPGLDRYLRQITALTRVIWDSGQIEKLFVSENYGVMFRKMEVAG